MQALKCSMDLQKYVDTSITSSFVGALRLGAAVAALLFKAVVCQDETEDNRETDRTSKGEPVKLNELLKKLRC